MAADGASIVDRVYSMLVNLRADTGKPASKRDIHRALCSRNVSPVQVYEALRYLRSIGKVNTPAHGLFEPAGTQDRAVSLTDIPGGRIKLEIGDALIEFTAGEWERLAKYAAGHIMQPTRQMRAGA